jgi:hypothetical protein
MQDTQYLDAILRNPVDDDEGGMSNDHFASPGFSSRATYQWVSSKFTDLRINVPVQALCGTLVITRDVF